MGEGEAPAEPKQQAKPRLGGSLALPEYIGSKTTWYEVYLPRNALPLYEQFRAGAVSSARQKTIPLTL